MKKSLLFGIIFTACVVIVTFVFSLGYPGGMISYWKFDEGSGTTAIDSVDANNGALVNSPVWTSGQVGGALSFDGIDDYVDCGNVLNVTNKLTIEAWVKDSGVSDGNVVGKFEAYDKRWHIYIDSMEAHGPALIYWNIGGSTFAKSSTSAIGTDWHHLAMVYDGTQSGNEGRLQAYIDGAPITLSYSGTIPATMPAISANVNIGRHDTVNFFKGILDEVAIYDRALTVEEIEQHYLDGLNYFGYEVECVTPPLGMVSWWPGDETMGATTEDIVCANHGTLIGGTTFASGKVEQALSLNGSGYVMIPNDPSLMPEQFTLDAWVKPVALRTTSWDSIISHGASGSDSHMGCCLDSYWLGFYREKPTLHTAHVGVSGDQRLSGPDPVTLNEWHHIAGSFDGTTKKLYLDGNLVASTVIESAIAYEDVPVLIGEDINNNSPAGLKFRGLIDEVEIFDRALDASEIQAIYLAGSAGKCKEFIQVDIDIKPGSDLNEINLGSQGVIPVAILSSACFDARMVVPETVELGGAGVAVRGKGSKFMAHEKDVNGDGLVDLVVQVETENLDPNGFQDGIVVLTGETYDGEFIEGSDGIIIVPEN